MQFFKDGYRSLSASCFSPALLLENQLKAMPDSSICSLVPMGKSEIILARLLTLQAGREQKAEAVTKHLHPPQWTIANPCAGLGRGQGEQETGCSSDVGEACWSCSTPSWDTEL